MSSMSKASAGLDWAGALSVRLGAPPGQVLRSNRPMLLQNGNGAGLLQRLVHGLPAQRLPDRLASLFGLCAQAHRLCARLALHAAGLGEAPPAAELERALRHECAAEHVRRIALDWPRQLAGLLPEAAAAALPSAASTGLADCPWLRASTGAAGAERAAAQRWLERTWLGLSAEQWLLRWDADARGWLHEWAAQQPLWPSQLLRQVLPLALELPAVPHLPLPSAAGAWEHWHHTLETSTAATLAAAAAPGPRWQAGAAQTGLATRATGFGPGCQAPWHSADFLGARIAELARLSLLPLGSEAAGHGPGPADAGETAPETGAAPLLAWGWRSNGPGQGLAWVETARGLLLHQLSLTGSANTAQVKRLQVLAPTDWNFAPDGVAAQALERLNPADPRSRAQAQLLLAALDPCVPWQIETKPTPISLEHCHA